MNTEKTIEELADLVGGSVAGDKTTVIKDIASLDDAGPCDITFVSAQKFMKQVQDSKAGAIIVSAEDNYTRGRNLIIVADPYLAFARIMELFRPQLEIAPGSHPSAIVHPSASIGKDVSIMAFAVIDEAVVLGDNVKIFPGVHIARSTRIGASSIIYSNCTIREDTFIGERVIIHSNTVIGSDGFGYTKDGDTFVKIPQRGTVRIEDDCEIGASVTIDRATIGETIIGRRTKVDNLVQIAHNVTIGEDSIIVSQVGISGSTKIGNRVQIGGQVGILGHIVLGDDSSVGAMSGVAQNIAPGETHSGFPAIPHRTWLRSQSIIKKLPEMRTTIKRLEARIKALEEDS